MIHYGEQSILTEDILHYENKKAENMFMYIESYTPMIKEEYHHFHL